MDRPALLRLGLRYELATIVCMLLLAGSTITAGILAKSALLLAVGAGSGIDMLSACALYVRLGLEIRHTDKEKIHRLEHRSARLVGILLVATAVYTLAISAYKLSGRSGAEDSYLGIGVSVLAAIFMPILAKRKTSLATELKSPALYADGMGTLVCGLMAIVVLIGLGANALLHWWWLDSIGALLLIPMLVKEGLDAWKSA